MQSNEPSSSRPRQLSKKKSLTRTALIEPLEADDASEKQPPLPLDLDAENLQEEPTADQRRQKVRTNAAV